VVSRGLGGTLPVVIFRRGDTLASPCGSKNPQLHQPGNDIKKYLTMTFVSLFLQITIITYKAAFKFHQNLLIPSVVLLLVKSSRYAGREQQRGLYH